MDDGRLDENGGVFVVANLGRNVRKYAFNESLITVGGKAKAGFASAWRLIVMAASIWPSKYPEHHK